MKKIGKLYISLLEWATSTKEACFLLTFLIIVSVFLHPPTDVQGWLVIIVSVYYQGVALPGIGSQQKTESNETRQLLDETHSTVLSELTELKEVHAQTTLELQAIGQNHALLLEQLAEIRKDMNLLQNGGNKHE